MTLTISRTARCVALTLGFSAFAVPLLSSASPLHGTTDAADSPERIFLAQADATPQERPVSYSAEQSDRGKAQYQKDCEDCHGKDLKGGMNGGASLRSVSFLTKYSDDMNASGLFGYMSSAMPPSNPGRYSASTYADLMAYILDRNGFSEGAPLPDDLDALDLLTMTK
ncbi:cytochrome c [Puniceibacterium sp. IMCC21224]|uniref:c-type cytochrome n=1 Tax=Puniceibacterium sp. IMCC21224 TaxID=1618204 RepID=UPI0018CD62C4|nr:cytochrome c [Puniceibacterium sp. IMCC21224]